jgi:hypothetical protein
MAAHTKGNVYPTPTGFGIRWQEKRRRQHQSGFATKTEARA